MASTINTLILSDSDRLPNPQVKRIFAQAKADIEDLQLGTISAANEAVSDPTAINITSTATLVTMTAGTDAEPTLADGQQGQRKIIMLVAKGSTGNCVVTPANLFGGTTVTLDAVGEVCELIFLGTEWVMIGGNGTLA